MLISAYLDGELAGEELEDFEATLKRDDRLAREVRDLRRIETQLVDLGREILNEEIPPALLDIVFGRDRPARV